MDIDQVHIDDTVLALLFLGRHDGMRTWKSFDWAAVERLHTKGLISDPVGKAKSVVFTDEGLRQSEASFRKLFTVGRESMRRVRIRPDCRASSATGDPAATSPVNAINSRFIDHLVRQKDRSFTPLLVHRIIPKAIEFFLDHPRDIPPA